MARARIVIPEAENGTEQAPADESREPVGDPLVAEIGDIAQLSDQQYADWNWWVHRLKSSEEMARDPKGKPRVLVTRLTGPVDVLEIQNRFGGGVYEFWGYFDRQLKIRASYELAGPPKRWDQPAPQQPVQHQPHAQPNNEAAELIGKLLARLDVLEAKITPPAPTVAQGLTVKDLIQLMPLLKQESTRSPDANIVKEMMGLVKEGIELGRSQDGGDAGTNWGTVIEKAAPVAEKLLTGLMAARRRPPPPAGVRTASSAEVVEREPQIDAKQLRQAIVVESLARAIAQGVEPGDFCGTLEHVLPVEELALLKLATTERVMVDLLEAKDRFPIFATDEARAYVDALLEELRNPSEDGDTE